MVDKKESSKDNPLFYWVGILIAVGLVGYRFVSGYDKTILINTSINFLLIIIAGLLLGATIIFSLKAFFEREENLFTNTKVRSTAITISILFVVVALFRIDYTTINADYFIRMMPMISFIAIITLVILVVILYFQLRRVRRYINIKK